MKYFVFILSIVLILSCSKEEEQIATESQFYTTDIDLFWEVFDEGKFTQQDFDTKYIEKGSIGLRDYALQKNLSLSLPSILNSAVYLEYYESVRTNTLNLTEAIDVSQNAFDRLKSMYPDTDFFDVYFIIGSMSAGGRISQNGLIIATEMFSKGKFTSVDNLSEWHQNVLRNKEFLPSIVIHEFVHMQQQILRQGKNNGTLLEQSIIEGMADFISHQLLLDHPFLNSHIHDYADPREKEIWNQFKSQKELPSTFSDWLYSGSQTAEGHPADIGYYVGYKILESYSANFSDMSEAISNMLSATDYKKIFNESRYTDKFK